MLEEVSLSRFGGSTMRNRKEQTPDEKNIIGSMSADSVEVVDRTRTNEQGEVFRDFSVAYIGSMASQSRFWIHRERVVRPAGKYLVRCSLPEETV